jgi:hypothetical protein
MPPYYALLQLCCQGWRCWLTRMTASMSGSGGLQLHAYVLCNGEAVLSACGRQHCFTLQNVCEHANLACITTLFNSVEHKLPLPLHNPNHHCNSPSQRRPLWRILQCIAGHGGDKQNQAHTNGAMLLLCMPAVNGFNAAG